MYDLPREELDKERKLRMWVLDNNCLYMKHVLAENPDIDLWMFTPTWHALNHGYVRPATVALRTYCPLIRRSQHCQVKNCGLYKLFVALRDGEVCERVWYELSPVHGVLRTSAAVRVIAWARLYLSEVPSQHRRRDVLEFAFHRISQPKLMSFPELLDRMRDHANDKLGAC
jgi:hypothetical protein